MKHHDLTVHEDSDSWSVYSNRTAWTLTVAVSWSEVRGLLERPRMFLRTQNANYGLVFLGRMFLLIVLGRINL